MRQLDRGAVGSDPIAPSAIAAMALSEGLNPPSLDGEVYLGISLHVRIPRELFHVKQSTVQCVRRG